MPLTRRRAILRRLKRKKKVEGAVALQRTTIWICDLCGKEDKVLSTDTVKGLSTPKGWDEKEIRVMVTGEEYLSRHVLMCFGCFEDFKNLYSLKEESKQPLKRPFWQKLLRGKND